jgi:hypothetical protein
MGDPKGSDLEQRSMSAAWLLVTFSLATAAIVFVVGGTEERIFAGAQALSAIGDILIGAGFTGRNVGGEMVIDLALLAVILAIAVKANKVWPLFAASLCAATVMTEVAQIFAQAGPFAYSIIQAVWESLALVVVTVGAWQVWRGRRQEAAG